MVERGIYCPKCTEHPPCPLCCGKGFIVLGHLWEVLNVSSVEKEEVLRTYHVPCAACKEGTTMHGDVCPHCKGWGYFQMTVKDSDLVERIVVGKENNLIRSNHEW